MLAMPRTKVVEYYPNVCIIEDCLEYLYLYSRIPCGTHSVYAVIVVAIVVAIVVVVIVVVKVVVAVVVPAN